MLNNNKTQTQPILTIGQNTENESCVLKETNKIKEEYHSAFKE